MRMCSVYFRPKEIVVHAKDRDAGGLWVATNKIHKLARDANNGELGSVIRSMLAQSQRGVPRLPYEEKAKNLKSLGIESWYTFTRQTKLIIVEQKGRTITLIPTERKEVGSYDFRQKTRVEADISDEELGASARIVLAECD